MGSWMVAVYLISNAFSFSISPTFSCGIYSVTGFLRKNSLGNYVLRLQEKSRSPHELILLGGKLGDKFKRVGSVVQTEFYVPQPIASNQRSFVFVQDLRSADLKNKDKVIRISGEKCRDKSKFVRP